MPIAPILLGECASSQIAEIIYPAWVCPETLLVISSDLYHYLPRAEALAAGMTIARAIERNNAALIGPETACGYVALRGLMQLAVSSSYYWRTLAVGHSGQRGGLVGENLVGYGAFLLVESPVHRVIN